MTSEFSGKRILVTGGTGSLGKALLLRAKEEKWDCEFIIFSRDETKQARVRQKFPQHTYVLGDVAKFRDVRRIMSDIDVVFHFAAYKSVPSAQNNVPATIETNIIGSQNVVDAALECGVEKVVASSTDKSCAPANLYGASKSVMEAIFQNANRYGKTTFHLTRYGNVVSSNASVIPLFKRQAAEGGPLTVTDFRMTRFWITLDQAVDLILLALTTNPGVIVVPKAPSMAVYDVAKTIGGDLPIIETQIRPGEKIHEEMVTAAESFYTLESEEHFFIYPPTGKFRNAGAPFNYASNAAAHELTSEELLEMIRHTEEKYGS